MAAGVDKNPQEALIQKMQTLEQNMQQVEAQKQQLHAQLLEIDNAVKELETASEAYKILNAVMVKTDPKKFKAELQEKQEQLKVHVSLLEKQEKKMSEKTEQLRQEVLGTLKKE